MLFKRVTIIGLGLIGGSLGMAIRRQSLAKTVVGYSRTPATIRKAKVLGAIDPSTSAMRAAVRDSALVLLAAPVDQIASLGRLANGFRNTRRARRGEMRA